VLSYISELFLGFGLHVSISPLSLNFMGLFETTWDIWSTKMKWFANSGLHIVLQINISHFQWINCLLVWSICVVALGPMTCFFSWVILNIGVPLAQGAVLGITPMCVCRIFVVERLRMWVQYWLLTIFTQIKLVYLGIDSECPFLSKLGRVESIVLWWILETPLPKFCAGNWRKDGTVIVV